jgi:hypothetical protein
MDVTDEIFLLETNPIIKYLSLTQKKKEKQFWVDDIFAEREKFGEFHTLFPKILVQSVKFFECMRMSPDTFYYILYEIKPFFEKQSNFRKCITPAEKLTVTLR